MSEREFETYLNLLARFLKLSPRQRAAIEKELRAHLEERLEELREKGFSREDAIETALAEFGDAAGLADDFAKATRGPILKRRIMQTGIGTLAAATAIALTFTFLLPENRQGVPERPQTLAEVAEQAADTSGDRPETRLVASESIPALEALRKSVSIDVQDGTLAKVFEQLEQQVGIEIFIRWGGPEESPAGPGGPGGPPNRRAALSNRSEDQPREDQFRADRQTTFQINDATAEEALQALSEQLPEALRVEIRRNALVVEPWPRWVVAEATGPVRRLYEVSDLLAVSDRTLSHETSHEKREDRLIRLINAGGVGGHAQDEKFDAHIAWQFAMFDGFLSIRPQRSSLASQRTAERLLTMLDQALAPNAAPIGDEQSRKARLLASETAPIRAKLEQRVSLELDEDEQPWALLDALEEQTGVTFHTDWKLPQYAAEEATFRAEDVPAIEALEQMLPLLRGRASRSDSRTLELEQFVELRPDGVHLIDPHQRGFIARYAYMYDVHDLLSGDGMGDGAEREAAFLRTISSSLPTASGSAWFRSHVAVYDGVLCVQVTEEERDSIEQTLIMLREATNTRQKAD